ncbi:MAG: 3-oxoacid CoA-transferase [Verrucomicrobia bacterium]|nr:3-oxoacid CoA-transferase [Verrucomicrobiota bacterium]MDA1066675.1 3-oxoacid CoA-transferase [Verrucomicrobiota bacterium]
MKTVPIITAEHAASLVHDGDTLLGGGFGMTGNPVRLLHALARTEVKDLTFVANNVGEINLGGGRLLRNGQLRKMVGSYFTSNHEATKAIQTGEVDHELLPQGTLAEAIRAGGAGLGGFFTPTSAGTLLAEGCETKVIDGVEQVLVKSIRGNVAFIRAWKADTAGNLVYRMTEQNFNKAMATAADIVIAEVQEIVPVGEIVPESIHTPGCFVDYLVESKLSLEDLGSSSHVSSDRKIESWRLNMAKRAYQELKRGDVVNLGIGIPTLVSDYISEEDGILLHSENGMLGVGPTPTDGGGAMHYPVNAGKVPVTPLKGCSYFDSADSFAMIRGGHVDVAIIGGLEVDESGNLANWAVPGKPVLGVGGAMDLASGAKRLIVTLKHTGKNGESKVVPQCTLPLTAKHAVSMIITDLAVFNFENDVLTLIEMMPGASLEDVRNNTEAKFIEKLS